MVKNVNLSFGIGNVGHVQDFHFDEFEEDLKRFESPKREPMVRNADRYWYRNTSDKSPYYYAQKLLRVKGQTVEWALRKFKKRFTDPYALEAFERMFKDHGHDHINANTRWTNRNDHVRDGIITQKLEIPRKIKYQTYDYKLIYWDPYNLTEVSKDEYNDYNKYVKHIFINRECSWDIHRVKLDFKTREKFARAYPMGIEIITKGEMFEVNRNSKEERTKRAKARIKNKDKYNFRHLSDKQKLHYDSWLYAHNKEINKKKREEKEKKTNGNFSLVFSEDLLKYLQKQGKNLKDY